jgi:hypothetical protein
MKNITCKQAEELFSPLLDGFISPGDEAMLRAHLEECPACAGEFGIWNNISASLRQMPRANCPDPGFSQNVIAGIEKMGRERTIAGRLPAWKKGIAAAAAAALIMAGSLSLGGGLQGLQVARQGPGEKTSPGGTSMVAANHGQPGTGPVEERAGTGENDTPVEPENGNKDAEDNAPVKPEQVKTRPGTADNNAATATAENGDDTAKPAESKPAQVLLSSNLVVRSTVLKLAVENAGQARAGAESMVAAAAGRMQLLANQNTDQGTVIISRISVQENQATQLINNITGLGSIIDRQEDSRNITTQYNSLAARYNELAGREDTTEAELTSIKQQLDGLKQDAGNYTIVLWLQQK